MTTSRPAAPRGRPPVSDVVALDLMQARQRVAVQRGEPMSIRALAREVSHLLRMGGASPSSVEDRLRRKFVQRSSSASGDFPPNMAQASSPEITHRLPRQERDAMYHGSARQEPEHPTEEADSARATVKVVDAPPWKNRPGDPPLVISLRVALAPDAMVEHRLSPSVARELAEQLAIALAEHDHRLADAHGGAE